MAKKNLAWHFVGATLRDGSPVPADGEWLKFKGKCVICKSGLHASRNPFDALKYAFDNTLCLVEVDGIAQEDEDKLVCSRRKIIARMDATDLLRYFARMQAISVLGNWQTDPPDCVLDWLMGDEAARATAEAAARAAAKAVEAAVEAAAWSAARSVVWSTAVSAVEAAMMSATRTGATSAARTTARNEFTQLVHECFEDFI